MYNLLEKLAPKQTNNNNKNYNNPIQNILGNTGKINQH